MKKISKIFSVLISVVMACASLGSCINGGAGDGDSSSFAGGNSSVSSGVGESASATDSDTTDGSAGDSTSSGGGGTSSESASDSSSASESVCNHSFSYESGACVAPTLTSAGERVLDCAFCDETQVQTLPVLNATDYDYTAPSIPCIAGIATFTSEAYGNYTATVDASAYHTNYAGECETCHTCINNLQYETENIIPIFQNTTYGAYYPRMLRLKNGDLLCAFEYLGPVGDFTTSANRVVIARSTDDGETWSSETTGEDAMPVASVMPTNAEVSHINDSYKYNCSNAALFQMDDGSILCAFKAASSSDTYGRYIFCSISYDDGYTWEYHSEISNCWRRGSASKVKSTINNKSGVGVHEPIFGVINDELTVMYADDFWPMFDNVKGSVSANHQTQYLVSKVWDDTSCAWVDETIVQNGATSKTVASGVTNTSRDGMPGFAQLSTGEYVMVMEGTYYRSKGHPFVILMSYSEDGVNWTTPITIYEPSANESKAAAPYVTVTKDDRIVISFQTDEDSVAAGTGTGDWYSVLKTIVSDGTPVDEITGIENFYTVQSVFNTANGLASVWPSNYYDVETETVYCMAGVNFSKKGTQNAIHLQKVKIGADAILSHTETTAVSDEYSVRKGSFVATTIEDWIICTTAKSLLFKTDTTVYNGEISVNVIPRTANDCGLIFRASASATGTVWENNSDSYYLFIVNRLGCYLLGYWGGSAGWKTIVETTIPDFDPGKIYNLRVTLDGDEIDCYLNGQLVYEHTDTLGLTGTAYGLRCNATGVWFGDLQATSND